MTSPEAQSFRLSFENGDEEGLTLSLIRPCLTTPVPSVDRGERVRLTGFWFQLETALGEVLYRRDRPGLMLPRHQELDEHYPRRLLNAAGELKAFDLLVPNIPEAAYVAIYAPPREENGRRPHLGAPSELVGRFALDLDAPSKVAAPAAAVSLPADICGSGRGEVIRIVHAVNHGRIGNIYNLVVLAEAFLDTGQEDFLREARVCLDYLLSRPPFNSSMAELSLNVIFVEVASNKNGINNPTETYFAAESGSGTTSTTWDQACVTTVCDALFSQNNKPYWNWAGLLCNTTDRIGTARGDQFASGLSNNYELIFQHEFGHSAFDLGDEYDGTKGTFSGVEPAAANLTIQTDKTKLKWNRLLTPDLSIPTLGNPADCDVKDDRKNPVADSDVGLYAGGRKYSCSIYHPQYRCAMNKSDSADGLLCAVCLNEATRIVAQIFTPRVPTPGSVYYSPISRSWSQATVASNSVTVYGSVRKKSADFQAVISELRSGQAGTEVRKVFSLFKRPLPASLEVYEAHFDIGQSEGLWYLIDTTDGVTFFLRTYLVTIDNFIQVGKVSVPSFPQLALFESVVVGTQVNIFSVDNGKLAKGRLDSSGNIVDGQFVEQTVSNLVNQLTSISLGLERQRIWVSAVDALSVKIASFELISNQWSASGFITMPVASPTDFLFVKQVEVNNSVHVLSNTNATLWQNTFDIVNPKWSGDAKAVPVTGNIAAFDTATDGNSLYLVTLIGAAVTMHIYSLGNQTWDSGTDITADLGLKSSSVVSSLGVAILKSYFHVVALVNQMPEHAILDLSTGSWAQAFTPIAPISSLASATGAMSLHATETQLYLALSEI